MKWSMRRRVGRQALIMDAMMSKLDVDRLALVRERRGRTFADARKACASCLDDALCRTWLAEAKRDAAAPAFCPNAALFERFRAVPAKGPIPDR